ADEHLADGAREAFVEGEPLAAPVAACAELDHLALDGVARFGLPLPDALLEFFAAELAVVDALFGELAGHDHLGGDAGVVCAGQPEGIVTAHAMPAGDDVNFGMLQHVAHVERAGDVRRGDDERKYASAGFGVGVEDTPIDPPPRPMRLE